MIGLITTIIAVPGEILRNGEASWPAIYVSAPVQEVNTKMEHRAMIVRVMPPFLFSIASGSDSAPDFRTWGTIQMIIHVYQYCLL
jgi:hypothetical protein